MRPSLRVSNSNSGRPSIDPRRKSTLDLVLKVYPTLLLSVSRVFFSPEIIIVIFSLQRERGQGCRWVD